jgi:CBS domain-containing protein
MNRLTIRSIMSTELVTVESDHSFNLAEGIMRMERIRHLPVVEDGRRLVGLVTHWDIAQAQASFLARPLGENLAEELNVPVAKIMQTRVLTVSPDTPVVEAARILIESDHHLVGIVTESDFLDLLIEVIDRDDRARSM